MGDLILCRHCGKPLHVANDYAGPTWAHKRHNGAVFDCGNPTRPVPALDFEPTSEREIEASKRHGWTPASSSQEKENGNG